MRYQVTRYRPELRTEVAALLAARMNRDPETTARYIRWKYEESPYFDEPLLWVVGDGGRIVGMRGAYATVWRLPDVDQPIVLPCFCDTAVAPEYSNRGIFSVIMQSGLADLRERGYSHVLNLSATRVVLLGSLATGWRAVGRPTALRRVPLRLRVREQLASVPTLRSAYRRVRAGPAGAAQNDETDPFTVFDARIAAARGAIESAATPPPDASAALAARWDGAGRIRAACDARDLAWRLANPAQQHRVVVAHEHGELTACLVLRGSRGLSRVVVADWQARSPEQLERLAATVARAGAWPEIDVWSGPCPRVELEPFRRAGFVEAASPRAAALLVRPTIPLADDSDWRLEGIDLRDENAWQVRMLQSPLWFVPSGGAER